MDIVNLLAPFATKNLRTCTQLNPTCHKPQTIAISSRCVRFTSTAPTTNSNNLKLTNKPQVSQIVEGNWNRFTVYHKKSNLQFVRDAQTLAYNRKLNFQENIKEKRAQVMNNNREFSNSVFNELKIGKSVNTKEMNSRKEQLMRWKQEKLELMKKPTTGKSTAGKVMNIRKDGKKEKELSLTQAEPASLQGNKFGAIQLPRAITIHSGMTTRSRSGFVLQEKNAGSNLSKRIVNHEKVINTRGSVVLQDKKIGNTLPLRTVPFEMTGCKRVGLQDNNSENIQPVEAIKFAMTTRRSRCGVLIQDKSLETVVPSISTPSMTTRSRGEVVLRDNDLENIPPPNASHAVSSELNFQAKMILAHSPAIKKTIISFPTVKNGVAHSPVLQKAFSHSPAFKNTVARSPAIKKTVANSPAIKKGRKLKGMQFDSIYKEFNDKFIVASTILSDYTHKWVNILSDKAEELPDDVICEIESSVGQAKLLMESKLPQFAELLYFYLSRTLNPHPVLHCDLDGWWEVAAISIEKVTDRFIKLEKLSSNQWKPEMSLGKIPSKQRVWV